MKPFIPIIAGLLILIVLQFLARKRF